MTNTGAGFVLPEKVLELAVSRIET